jgi:hypothetical protein
VLFHKIKKQDLITLKNMVHIIGCVRDGLGESFEILFNGDYFNADTIETYKLYPKFACLEGDPLDQPGTPS